MCDARCTSARSPPSACHCSCGGANHGRGFGAGIRFRRRGYRVPTPSPYMSFRKPYQLVRKPTVSDSVKSFLVGVGKSALVGSLVYGLSTGVPPLGTVAIPAYSAYSYAKAGKDLYDVYSNWKSGQRSTVESVKEASGTAASVATGDASDRIAMVMVSNLNESGVIGEIAKQTNVNSNVYSQMLQGSISSATSEGLGEIAKFTVGKVVGA